MRIFASKPSATIFLSAILVIATVSSACQSAAVNNGNTSASNTDVANTTANSNVTIAVPEGAVINTREPDRYRATLVLMANTQGGDRAVAIPEVSAQVARNGQDRRVSFKLPDGEEIIYLDRADKRYIIRPKTKQYAELTPDATGFEIQRLMTPGQLVAYLEKQRGYERVGEEQWNGRMADKYRYVTSTNTGTQAGQVKSETFIYVDKETGLPLHTELVSEASGNTEGAPKSLRFVAEMRDLQTNVDPSIFEIPAGMNKVAPDQVKQQVEALSQAVAAIIGTLLKNVGTPGTTTTTTTTTTAASPTPTASATPSPVR